MIHVIYVNAFVIYGESHGFHYEFVMNEKWKKLLSLESKNFNASILYQTVLVRMCECVYVYASLSFFLTLCLPMFVFAFFKQWVYYAIEVYNFTKRS